MTLTKGQRVMLFAGLVGLSYSAAYVGVHGVTHGIYGMKALFADAGVNQAGLAVGILAFINGVFVAMRGSTVEKFVKGR